MRATFAHADELIWSRPEAMLPYLQHQAERL